MAHSKNYLQKLTKACLFQYGALLFALLVLPGVALGVIEIAPLSNEELEGRYRDLIEELRCPKCQNQNLADSNAPIATDLRAQVRKLLEEGKSDEEIIGYLVHRYGDFVHYRPALNRNTLLLWFIPGALFLLGVVAIWIVVRSRRSVLAPESELSSEELQRLRELAVDSSAEGSNKT